MSLSCLHVKNKAKIPSHSLILIFTNWHGQTRKYWDIICLIWGCTFPNLGIMGRNKNNWIFAPCPKSYLGGPKVSQNTLKILFLLAVVHCISFYELVSFWNITTMAQSCPPRARFKQSIQMQTFAQFNNYKNVQTKAAPGFNWPARRQVLPPCHKHHTCWLP